MSELITPRLRLRRARTDDLDGLHAILSDARAMHYWSTPPHGEIAQTRERLSAMIASPQCESNDFIIDFEGRVIGKMGAWRLPEIGFLLAPDCWRKGLASEAMAAFLPHVFERTELVRLTVRVRQAAADRGLAPGRGSARRAFRPPPFRPPPPMRDDAGRESAAARGKIGDRLKRRRG